MSGSETDHHNTKETRMSVTTEGPTVTIAVATLRETNYPYARGFSRRVSVTIG
jgi:hypothetical protein